jgi:3-dehydroquinate synthase
MVDSSIGGKTGINLLHGKNLIGTIWQPKAVVIDPELLSSLPKREITSAMGEIIKYSVIFDRDLFALIEKNLDLLLDCSKCSQLNEIIGRCTKLKADIIVEDERENGKRRILNFGHTIGHALETYFGFNILRHGEAIAYGILAAAELSIEYAKLEHQQFDLIKNIIKRLPLPKLPNFSSKNIIQLMQSDKKIQFGKINFILLEDIGSAVVQNNISEESIINILEAI